MRIVVLCGLLVLLALLMPSTSEAITANSCSNVDVQAAIDDPTNGGVVIVPAGNCNWITRVVIASKALTLTGATVCTGGSGSAVTCTDNTNITDQTTGTACPNGTPCALAVSGSSATNFVNISGFTFIKSTAHAGGLVQINGTIFTQAFRFHHNHIIQASVGSRGMAVMSVYGLIDHNFFDVTSAGGSIQSIQVIGTAAATDGGFTPWQQPLTLGSNNAVYLEDNTITYNVAVNPGEDALDAYGGARFVVRHNRINNDGMGHHGTDSGNQRSPVSFEVYDNIFTNNGPAAKRAWTIRGGTGVFFNNTYTGARTWSGFALALYRACIFIPEVSAWGTRGCDGTNYELNSATLSSDKSRRCSAINGGTTGATTNNAGYPLGTTTITLAAAGTGNFAVGDLIHFGTRAETYTVTAGTGSGSTPIVGGTITFSPALFGASIPAVNTAIVNGGFRFSAATNESVGAEGATFTRYFDGSGVGGYPCRDQPGVAPGQVTDPIYAWNNSGSSVAFGVIVDPGGCQLGLPSTTWLLAERDYITGNTIPRPGYTAYTYPHPLAGPPDTTPPAAPTGFTVSQLERK